MKPIVLIGAGQFAEYVRFLVEHGLGEKVAAFCVTGEFSDSVAREKDGLPIVTMDELPDRYPPGEYCLAIAFTGSDMSQSRERAFRQCQVLGYDLPNLIHPSVIDQTVRMGVGNIIGAGTVLAPYTELGDGNILFDMAFLAHNAVLGSFNLLSTNITPMGNCVIGDHCYIGGGSVINNRVHLADFTLVGAQAYVKKDTAPYDVVVPARGAVLENHKSTDFGL